MCTTWSSTPVWSSNRR